MVVCVSTLRRIKAWKRTFPAPKKSGHIGWNSTSIPKWGALATKTSFRVVTDNDDEWPIIWSLDTSRASLDEAMQNAEDHYGY